MPAAARQPYLDQRASIINLIMSRHHQDSRFFQQKYEEFAEELLTNLRPLMNPRTNPEKAFLDLKQLAREAYDLSPKMLTSRLNFEFRFPEIGARFNTHSMIPVWPTTDAAELQAKHWRVALVTTPVITCCTEAGSQLSAHSIARADVLLMQ